MTEAIHPQTCIGHVHLKVSDLARAEAFYWDVFGFEVIARVGSEASFLSAGGYHHHIGLNTWQSREAPPAPQYSSGLYHFAILLPTRKELARAVQRILDHGVGLDGMSDHGVSEAIYLHDPDGNGIEIYRDRARSEWPITPDGSVGMTLEPLDLNELLAELNS